MIHDEEACYALRYHSAAVAGRWSPEPVEQAAGNVMLWPDTSGEADHKLRVPEEIGYIFDMNGERSDRASNRPV